MTTEVKGNYGYTDDVLGIGGKYVSPVKGCKGTQRLKGTVIADQNGTLRIFQGPSEAKPDDVVTEITITAGVNPGDGAGFTVDCVGLYYKIEFENTSGSVQTVFRLSWKIADTTF